jgi:hypothetical protein
MPYTREEGGILNNFAVEPDVYTAKPPTKNEQRNYLVLGVLGLLFVVGLVVVAVFASGMT